MNGEFFVLAFTAALNPKLLALDLLLIENRRARAMFACILAAGGLPWYSAATWRSAPWFACCDANHPAASRLD